MRFSKSFAFLSLFLNGVLVGALGMSAYADMSGSAVFSDVPKGSYFDQHVGDLYGAGIIKGSNGKFMPENFVTRADVAVMLGRLRNEIKGWPLDPVASTSNSSRSTSRSSTSRSSSASSNSSAAPVGAGVFQFGLDKFSIVRSAPRALISVNRVNGSKGSVSVKYKTVDGTAVAGTNYAAMEGTLTFADGETNQTITIPLKNNQPNGYNKRFAVELFDPSGATLGQPKVIELTLLDQGPDPNESSSSSSNSNSSNSSSSSTSSAASTVEFSAVAHSFSERAGTVTITVRRNGSTSAAASVNYNTVDQTAKTGTHYIQTNGKLDFAAGESTKTFTVSLMNRPSIDGNKHFNINLTSPSGTVLGDAPLTVVTVVDEDAVPISGSGVIAFTSTSFWAEKGTVSYVTVQRSINPNGTVTVQYATSDNTAYTNADYTPSTGTLTFLPGETTKKIPVTILAGAKSDRTINWTLASPTGGAKLGVDYVSIMTIQ